MCDRTRLGASGSVARSTRRGPRCAQREAAALRQSMAMKPIKDSRAAVADGRPESGFCFCERKYRGGHGKEKYISGERVTKRDIVAYCHNRHAVTGQERKKEKRKKKTRTREMEAWVNSQLICQIIYQIYKYRTK